MHEMMLLLLLFLLLLAWVIRQLKAAMPYCPRL